MKRLLRICGAITVFFLLLFLGFSSIGAEDLPLSSISKAEERELDSGKPIIRVLDSYEQIRLEPSSSAREIGKVQRRMKERFTRLKPNFLAEAVFILPVPAGDERKTLEEIKIFLQNVRRLEGIPYYSQQYDKYFPLFEDIEIQEQDFDRDGSVFILTEQVMKPFKPYEAAYTMEITDDYLLYRSYNETSLKYKRMRGVKPENMQTSLLVEVKPGYLFCYGLGGADAFTFFGLFGERLETSFIGRMEAFFGWFHEEFILPRLEN